MCVSYFVASMDIIIRVPVKRNSEVGMDGLGGHGWISRVER